MSYSVSRRISAQEFRANARQCLAWAEAAGDPENREAFFDLAETWEAAAARVEQSEAGRGRREIAAVAVAEASNS